MWLRARLGTQEHGPLQERIEVFEGNDLRVMQVDVGQRLERCIARTGVADPCKIRLYVD
jgi:hypothetical protein